MIQRFLTSKHWQLFLLMFVVPFMFEFIIMLGSMGNAIAARDPERMLNVFYFFPFLMLIVAFGIYGWQWSVAVGLHSKLPTSVRMNLRHFKIFFIFPIIYLLLFSLCMIWFVEFANEMSVARNPEMMVGKFASMFVVIILLGIFAFFVLFCQGYCLYFCAKTLRSIELGREAHFGDYIGDFFLILLHFIGVWFIQPRVNLVYEEYPDHPPGIEPQYPPRKPDGFTPPPPRIPQDYNREKLRGKDHDAFRYDDEFDGII